VYDITSYEHLLLIHDEECVGDLEMIGGNKRETEFFYVFPSSKWHEKGVSFSRRRKILRKVPASHSREMLQ
jgi:hypothetical protein